MNRIYRVTALLMALLLAFLLTGCQENVSGEGNPTKNKSADIQVAGEYQAPVVENKEGNFAPVLRLYADNSFLLQTDYSIEVTGTYTASSNMVSLKSEAGEAIDFTVGNKRLTLIADPENEIAGKVKKGDIFRLTEAYTTTAPPTTTTYGTPGPPPKSTTTTTTKSTVESTNEETETDTLTPNGLDAGGEE